MFSHTPRVATIVLHAGTRFHAGIVMIVNWKGQIIYGFSIYLQTQCYLQLNDILW